MLLSPGLNRNCCIGRIDIHKRIKKLLSSLKNKTLAYLISSLQYFKREKPVLSFKTWPDNFPGPGSLNGKGYLFGKRSEIVITISPSGVTKNRKIY
jgi:hypothetical protein